MEKIGVEQSLSHIQQALKDKGYEVIELKQESDASECSACVVTGLDSNFMGIHTTSMQGPVIEANGLTAEEVCNEVANKLS